VRRHDERATQARFSALLVKPPAVWAQSARRQALHHGRDAFDEFLTELARRPIEVLTAAFSAGSGKAKHLGWPNRGREF
jgi:hypothetical protein